MVSLLNIVESRIRELSKRTVVGHNVLDSWQARAARYISPGEYEYLDAECCLLNEGDVWATSKDLTVFMQRTLEVPADWVGLRVGLEMQTGGEGLLYIDDLPFHGVDDNRGYILLTPSAKGGEILHCLIEMKPSTPLDDFLGRDEHLPFILSKARMLALDREIEEAYYDFKVAYDSAAALKDPLLQRSMLQAAAEALQIVDFQDMNAHTFKPDLQKARQLLHERLSDIRGGDSFGRVFCTGHSHIDLAWLWPLKETARKVGRTYSTVMALMDEYPNYYFNCSQVPLFLLLKERYPSIYERVKQRIAEGRFEPIGGAWVEHDTNLVSGESMVRQCLYGQRFFRSEFGVDIKVGWLPDVFGYSGALPQIYRQAGLDYFVTFKLILNDTNRFPHNVFQWQGIDGTRISTHVVHNLPCGYSGTMKPEDILQQWDAYHSKPMRPEFLYAFGWGDGGGGPTREMLEYLPRLATVPGVPKARTGRVYNYLDRQFADTYDLPVWNGEIYFESHRGTYTSQAWNKRYNRKSELLYREAEMFCTFSALCGDQYPRHTLFEGWKTILLNQFHDIIPGSSIGEVHEESRGQYVDVLSKGTEARQSALARLAGLADTRGEGTPVVVFNSLSWPHTGVVKIDLESSASGFRAIGPDGEDVPVQQVEDGIVFVARDVPSCGFAVYHLVESGEPSARSPFTMQDDKVITPYYELTFSSDGTISRIFDRMQCREVLPDGARANILQVFEDKPSRWDAWEIELQYQEKSWEFEAEEQMRLVESGPVRMVLGRRLRYGGSAVDQRIILYAHTPRIDFVNEVDWQERQTMLKAAFPVDVHAANATYEIAFGAIERPTHWNTSWDKARFEVSGHRWADLSEAGYGVSMLNDCKYGWDIKGNVMRLTLLRAPIHPDPEADRGRHEFTYSLFPHPGDWRQGVVRAGYELNSPLVALSTCVHQGELASAHSFVSVDCANVIVDTVKQAEDSTETVIRVYEAHGARGSVVLSFDRPLASAVECNLLEEEVSGIDFDGAEIHFNIRPYEIRTFKASLA